MTPKFSNLGACNLSLCFSGAKKTYYTEVMTGSYPNKERLDHAVGSPALRLTTVIVDGHLNDSHYIVTKLQLGEK